MYIPTKILDQKTRQKPNEQNSMRMVYSASGPYSQLPIFYPLPPFPTHPLLFLTHSLLPTISYHFFTLSYPYPPTTSHPTLFPPYRIVYLLSVTIPYYFSPSAIVSLLLLTCQQPHHLPPSLHLLCINYHYDRR